MTLMNRPVATGLRRAPVMGDRVVATSHPLASQAGMQTLVRGGNAVDAAIAMAAALTVVEPTNNGLGGDAFAQVWFDGALYGLNASGRAPRAMTASRYRGLDRVPDQGWNAVTVPGGISAWTALWRRFGRLPFGEVLEPAIRFAERGVPVLPGIAAAWAAEAERLRGHATWEETFLVDGRPPRAGQRVKLPHHALTLRALAETEGIDFYRGELAQCIAAASRAQGGPLGVDDLAEHAPDWVTPLSVTHRGVTLHELPPNGQGIAALSAIGILAAGTGADSAAERHGPDSAAGLHRRIEAVRCALSDAWAHVADVGGMSDPPESLIAPDYLARRAATLRADASANIAPGHPRRGGTVYFCVGDDDGNLVSMIQSNYHGFGSGIVVPGTGIALHNRATGFSLMPGHPNEVGPGKRPFHTLAPGFATRRGTPWMAFGVMGGAMQAQGHAQLFLRCVEDGMTPQQALDAPRFRVEPDGTVWLEPGWPDAVVVGLRARGHRVRLAAQPSVFFGGAQAVATLDDGYVGASDNRRDGQAVAW